MRWVGLVVAATLLGPVQAAAGEPVSIDQAVLRPGYFRVALCAAKPFNAIAGDYRFIRVGHGAGMVGHACGELAPGQRGLLTASRTGSGAVARLGSARVVLQAPPGTTFEQFKWGGRLARFNCLFEAAVYGVGATGSISQVVGAAAAPGCPRAGRELTRIAPVAGATSIVQRVACFAPLRRACSRRRPNYVRTTLAEVLIRDPQPPAVAIQPGTLTSGAWLKGKHDLVYDATDNVGVRSAAATVDGVAIEVHQRSCAVAVPEGGDESGQKGGEAFANSIPCVNGPGILAANTDEISEGTHDLAVRVVDAAGNPAVSPSATLRVDRTPPARVDVALQGPAGWRREPEFNVTWNGDQPPDRAPVVAAHYRLCPSAGGGAGCITGEQAGGPPTASTVRAPSPGEWALRLWLRDEAGNGDEANASSAVMLRHDPLAPELALEGSAPGDPTVLRARVSDGLSGVAAGSIEVSRQASGTWQALATTIADGRLSARVDDALLPAGTYQVRASATDHAGNVAATDRGADGRPLLLTLPLRSAVTLRAGVPRTHVTRVRVRRGGRMRVVRRRTQVIAPSVRARHGSKVLVAGQLVAADGTAVARAPVDVHAIVGDAPARHVATLSTDADGRFGHAARAAASQTLRFTYPGSATALPAGSDVHVRVPAVTSIGVSRSAVLNGQTVTFRGAIRTLPVPARGKLVELQAYLNGRWQSFRTFHSDRRGRWQYPYEFRSTRGTVRFAFRVRLIREAGSPYETGASRVIFVRVRGQ